MRSRECVTLTSIFPSVGESGHGGTEGLIAATKHGVLLVMK